MQIFTLQYTATFDTVYVSIKLPQSRVASHPLTADKASGFETVIRLWHDTFQTQRQHLDDIMDARSRVKITSLALERLVDRCSQDVKSTSLDSRKPSALYLLLFKDKAPFQVKRLPHPSQLSFMRAWISPLKDTNKPRLETLSEELADALSASETAQRALTKAIEAYREFRITGGFKMLIDTANSVRSTIAGEVSKLHFDDPDAGLPPNHMAFFFPPLYTGKPKTEEELKHALEQHDDKRIPLQARYDEAVAIREAREAKKAVEAAKAHEEELAAAQAAFEAAQARLEALQNQNQNDPQDDDSDDAANTDDGTANADDGTANADDGTPDTDDDAAA